jgi:mono/diheme cytochrome c family protein
MISTQRRTFHFAITLFFVASPVFGQASYELLNPQYWTPKERQDFYHLAEGSEVFPLDWLRALEVETVDDTGETVNRRFLDNIERFGFLPDPDSAERLPVGLTADVVLGQEHLGKQVGLNCAACHVSSMKYNGKELRIDGGPNLLNTRAFFAELADASKATLSRPAKLAKFIQQVRRLRNENVPDAVLPNIFVLPDVLDKSFTKRIAPLIKYVAEEDIAAMPADEFWAKTKGKPEAVREVILNLDLPDNVVFLIKDNPLLEELLVKARLMKSRVAFLQRLAGVGDIQGTKWGPGRVDAFGSARRFLFDPNYAPIHGVSYPALWDLYRTKSFHYDSNTNSFLERNIGQALGVGAVYSKADYSSTIRLINLHELDRLASKLRAPKWPKAFGDLNQQRIGRGKVIFENRCQKCHSTGESWEESLSIDTDPRRAKQFALNVPGGPDFPAAIKSELAEIKKAAVDRLPDAERKAILAADMNASAIVWRATKKYSGRPLVAVWATAPYLHNGSVPTLEDLLTPAEKRPNRFFVGNREFDPVRVGYVSKAPDGVPNNFDVTVEGNGNFGHEFGCDLGRDEKDDLLEYLKST